MTVKHTLVSSDMRVFALCSLMELHRSEIYASIRHILNIGNQATVSGFIQRGKADSQQSCRLLTFESFLLARNINVKRKMFLNVYAVFYERSVGYVFRIRIGHYFQKINTRRQMGVYLFCPSSMGANRQKPRHCVVFVTSSADRRDEVWNPLRARHVG